MEQNRLNLLIVVYDIVLVSVLGFLAWKVSPLVLIGLLFFLGDTEDVASIELPDGTKIQACGDDAVSDLKSEIKHRIIMEDIENASN